MGVLITLGFLLHQLRQNTRALRADGFRSTAVMIHHPTTLMIQDAELTGIHARGIVASLLYLLQQIKRSDQTARAETLQGGLLPKVDYDAWLYYAATLLHTRGGKQLWAYLEVTITPTIRDVMNGYLEDNPDTPSYMELNPLLEYETHVAV
jgi:hypothetical protein